MATKFQSIYEKAKKYFVDATAGNKDPFVWVPGTVGQQEFFAACLLGHFKLKKSESGIDENGNFFPSNTLEGLRLDNFVGPSAFPQLTFNKNALFRLAIGDEKMRAKGLKTKSDFLGPDIISTATSPEFLETKIYNTKIDPIIYECVTKLAFYEWHRENFINNSGLKDTIVEKNLFDGSIVRWQDATKKSEVKAFIDKDGGPFYSGYPTICVIMENDAKDASKINQDDVVKIAKEFVESLFKRKLPDGATLITNGAVLKPETIKKYPLQTSKELPYVAAPVQRNGIHKTKICVGFDYSYVILQPRSVMETEKLDAVKVGINYFLNKKDAVPVTFETTEDIDAISAIKENVKKVADTLTKLAAPIKKGPPLYFNDAHIDHLAKEIYFYNYDSENVAKRILKKQYSPKKLDLNFHSLSIREVYESIVEIYKKQRETDPQFVGKYEPAVINEAITFVYDETFNLLAIVSKKSLDKAIVGDAKIKKEVKNVIPFDNISFYGDYYTLQELTLSSNYSFVNGIKNKEDLNQGIDGDVLMVTDFFVKQFQENYDKIITPAEYAKYIYANDNQALINQVENNLKKNNMFKQAENGPALNMSTPYVAPRDYFVDKVSHPAFYPYILFKSINYFFILGPLLTDREKTPSLEFLSDSSKKFDQYFNKEPKTLQTFLDRFHYPPLVVKPSAKKEKDERPSKEPIEKKKENAPGAEKQVDISDYNSATKAYFQEVLLVDAQVSEYACLNDLMGSLRGEGDLLTNLFEFLLTKFPWRQLLMNMVADQIEELKKLAPSNLSNLSDIEKALLCVENLDELRANFLRLKDAFLNFDDVIKADLPEIPAMAIIPYVPILDFMAAFKRKLIESIIEVIVELLSVIAGASIKELLKSCSADGSFAPFLSSKRPGEQIAGAMNVSENADMLPGMGSDQKLKMLNVSIVQLLKASQVDSLENILKYVKEYFNMYVGAPPTLINDAYLIKYLDAVSETIDASEVRSLLIGTALDEVVGFVVDVVERSDYFDPLSKDAEEIKLIDSFNSNIEVLELFNILNDYINLDLIGQQIAQRSIIVPDPCFADIGIVDTEDLELLLTDLRNRGFDPDADLTRKINDINDLIDKLCRSLDGFAGNLLANGKISLISDTTKKDLQNSVNVPIRVVTTLQGSLRQTTSNWFLDDGTNVGSVGVLINAAAGNKQPDSFDQTVDSDKFTDSQQKALLKKIYKNVASIQPLGLAIETTKGNPFYTDFKISSTLVYTAEIYKGEKIILRKKENPGKTNETSEVLLEFPLSDKNKKLGAPTSEGMTPESFFEFWFEGLLNGSANETTPYVFDTLAEITSGKGSSPTLDLSTAIEIPSGFKEAYKSDIKGSPFFYQGPDFKKYKSTTAMAPGMPAFQNIDKSVNDYVDLLLFYLTTADQSLFMPVYTVSVSTGNSITFDTTNPQVLNPLMDAFIPNADDLHTEYTELFSTLLDEVGSDTESIINDLYAYQKIINQLEGTPAGEYVPPPPPVELFAGRVDTLFKFPNNGKEYFFVNDKYYMWSSDTDKIASGYPRQINGNWSVLPDYIDAAFQYPGGGLYFFKGDEYWFWDYTTNTIDSSPGAYPRKIKNGWKGIPDNIDAAFYETPAGPVGFEQGGNFIYFFKGDEYWKWDIKAGKIADVKGGYPKKMSAWAGNGVTIPGDLDATYLDSITKKLYFFKENAYWSYDYYGDPQQPDNKTAVDGLPYPLNVKIRWGFPDG